MADENREPENNDSVQYSAFQVAQLRMQIKKAQLMIYVSEKVEHIKVSREKRQQAHEQARAEAITICEKYKLGKEEEAALVAETIAFYDEEFDKIKAEFEQRETVNREQRENNENEYDELILQEAETRKAYKQEKNSKEYKDFLAKNTQIEKDIKRYEDMKEDASTTIDLETLDKVIAGLKQLASQNPLNSYVEELKKIEARKKEIVEENKKLETQLTELEDKFEKSWDELDVKKNQALVDTKKKDLVKPTLGQRLSNFFAGRAKRREKAKIEAKNKREAAIKGIKEFGGFVGTSVANFVVGTKEKVVDWFAEKKQQRQEKNNALYESLSKKLSELQNGPKENSEVKIKSDIVQVPKGEGPIFEEDEDTIIEISDEDEKVVTAAGAESGREATSAGAEGAKAAEVPGEGAAAAKSGGARRPGNVIGKDDREDDGER